MNSIVTYRYDKKVINNIKGWQYGNNWPIVYIYYNDKKAYVGETLDAVRRTEQHIKEPEFDDFKYICLISNKTFNKSVVLDLESFLIKYMSADGKRKLINGNAGVVDHNYFYKEAYEDDFKAIWQYLLDTGVVQNSLFDIENSELFKYSPYKTLNKEQFDAVHQILNDLSDINNATSQSIIQVSGGAGTGKTILAVYLVKLLTDIKNKKDAWKYIDDPEEAEYVKWLSQKLGSINNIGFVVPMKQLRTTMKKIFKTIDGLSEKMIYAPEEVTDKYFDLLVVDEAHRLYKRNCLTSADLYITFDEINRKLMSEHFTGTENDLTELDWIIRSSRMQVLFYDEKQAIRSTDIGRTRYEKICKPSNGEESIILLQRALQKNVDAFFLDEPELGMGNSYIDATIRPMISDLAKKHKYVVIATHNANIAVRTLPYMSIFRNHGVGGYATYCGNPFNDLLINLDDDKDIKSWSEESLHTLEGGAEAFYERKDIYESKNN